MSKPKPIWEENGVEETPERQRNRHLEQDHAFKRAMILARRNGGSEKISVGVRSAHSGDSRPRMFHSYGLSRSMYGSPAQGCVEEVE